MTSFLGVCLEANARSFELQLLRGNDYFSTRPISHTNCTLDVPRARKDGEKKADGKRFGGSCTSPSTQATLKDSQCSALPDPGHHKHVLVLGPVLFRFAIRHW